jgi:hypothetical protein
MSLPSYSFGAEGVEFGRSSAYYALAGTGGGDGVTEIIAGSNITISPLNGQGAVTINATGSPGVTSVTGSGAGLSVSGPTGAVVLANTGVTSLVAGPGITVSGATGAVTVTSPTAPTIAPSAGSASLVSLASNPGTLYGVPNNANIITGAYLKFSTQSGGFVQFIAGFTRPLPGAPDPWSADDGFSVMLRAPPALTTGDLQQASMTVNFNPAATPPTLLVVYTVLGTYDTLRPPTDGPLISIVRIKGIPVPI